MSFLIIDRLNQFVTWIVTTAIVFVVALVILRLIANQANWNFFGWPAVTLRRLTDPLIGPVRRALMGFRVDPKYAPLVAILITILLGWLVVRVTDSVLGTIAGVMSAVQQQSIGRVIGHLLYGLLGLYILVIFVRIVFSWITVSYSNRVMRFLVNTTEPLLGPLRRMIPPVGMFDISPFVAFIIIWLCQTAVAGTLLR
jgi:YggT family protein